MMNVGKTDFCFVIFGKCENLSVEFIKKLKSKKMDAKQNKERKIKKSWSRDETMALLQFYSAREVEFQHSRRKKYAYAHVLEDMISSGVTDSNTTIEHLDAKMAALLRAYKAAKDNSKRTGAAPCIAPFVEQMDEIFGTKPTISNFNTISSGSNNSNLEIAAENIPPTPSASTGEENEVQANCAPKRKFTKAVYYEERLKQKAIKQKQNAEQFEQYMSLQREKIQNQREKIRKMDSLISILDAQ